MPPAASSLPIDLSRLPAPAIVQALSFDAILAALVADFRARLPEFDALLESDPAMKLLQAFAYRELLLRAEKNDDARSALLAFAGGPDLDHLAAFYGLARLVLAPATDTERAVLEPDEDFRARVQLAPELLTGIGMTAGGYRGLVLATVAEIRDVAIVRRGGGRIDLVLLGRAGDGTVSSDAISRVRQRLAADDATQLTDIVTVSGADIRPFAVDLTVRIRTGPDPAIVRAEVERAVRAHAADRHRIGLPVYRQQIEAAASVGGVELAVAAGDDILPGPYAAAWMTALTVTVVTA